MKKPILFLTIIAAATILACGCSQPEPEPIAGGSWKTNGPYNVLEQKTPDGTFNIYAQVNDGVDQVGLVEDSESFHIISVCKLGVKIQSVEALWETMTMEDKDGDGYDDFVVTDVFEDHLHSYVFLYHKDDTAFDEAPSEEFSFDSELPEEGK